MSNIETNTEKNKVKFDLEQRRILLSASLVSLIALISLTNQSLTSRNETAQASRSIASAERFMKLDESQLAWQKRLAQEMATKPERDIASLGHKASPFEQLRFGFFEGKYAFQLDHGKIKAIDFVESEFTSDRPKYITDKSRFLSDWHELFWVTYSKVEKVSETTDQNLVREKYKLLAGGEVVGYAQFLSDVHGRAHAIKVEIAN